MGRRVRHPGPGGPRLRIPSRSTDTRPARTTSHRPIPIRLRLSLLAIRFPGRGYFGPGENNRWVTLLGKKLVEKGYGSFYKTGPGPEWTGVDRAACAAFQRDQGWTGADADGYPGPDTWKRLFS
ncbi:peptidoglycan-binding protein [Streptomyces cinnamoneus]|uniref:peptidoglycan-binding protein n=1 Tax=Streptomyces cinnamoneus TaxID=53446 RepID=UPI0034452AB1